MVRCAKPSSVIGDNWRPRLTSVRFQERFLRPEPPLLLRKALGSASDQKQPQMAQSGVRYCTRPNAKPLQRSKRFQAGEPVV